ncbi:MAG: PH domain-containing protein [Clostridia bacterium]|nr:PH domain-containing protein [Clostridia bacterium]
MSKYNTYYSYNTAELPNPLVPGETLIWSAKPKRNAFIINRTITMLPIAIVWLFFDLGIMGSALNGETGFFMIPFFLLHLMPVWIWLWNAFTANRQWQNTVYYVTDRRIIIQGGAINADLQTIYYKDIRNVNLQIGLIDKFLGVGDLHFDLGFQTYTDPTVNRRGIQINMNQSPKYAFLDIENPHEVYPIIQKTVMDIQSDLEYPNAYRPAENPGYNTQYRP